MLQYLVPIVPTAPRLGRRVPQRPRAPSAARRRRRRERAGAPQFARGRVLSQGVLRLGHIERYVLTRSLVGVGAALGVIAFIIMLIDFVELSRTVGTRARDASVLDLFGLALLQSPQVIVLLLPFAFLFGVLFAYMNLNRRSELIAMRAAGVSAWRFILPAAMAAAVIGLVTVTAIHPLVSQMHAQFERRQAHDDGELPAERAQGDLAAAAGRRAQHDPDPRRLAGGPRRAAEGRDHAGLPPQDGRRLGLRPPHRRGGGATAQRRVQPDRRARRHAGRARGELSAASTFLDPEHDGGARAIRLPRRGAVLGSCP